MSILTWGKGKNNKIAGRGQKRLLEVKDSSGIIEMIKRKGMVQNMDIIRTLAEELGIKYGQAQAAVRLIDEGNTIPFISRYRKEATGALNDEVLRNLNERLGHLRSLEEKKSQVIESIQEQGKLTEELRASILAAETLVAVDDLYRPYRPKRRTRAMIAKERGLEPLADILRLQMTARSMEEEAQAYINPEKEVQTAEAALAGAMDIVAEAISDEAAYRRYYHGKGDPCFRGKRCKRRVCI